MRDVNPNTISREELARRVAAGKIVTNIINDLSDRSGFGFDNLDEDIRLEIRTTWLDIVLKGMP